MDLAIILFIIQLVVFIILSLVAFGFKMFCTALLTGYKLYKEMQSPKK